MSEHESDSALFRRTHWPRRDPGVLRGEFGSIAVIIFSSILALLLPESYGRNGGWWPQVVDLTTSLIPAIDRMAGVSEFGGVTRQVLTFLWFSLPVQVWLWLRSLVIYPDYARAHWIAIVLGLIMSITMFWLLGWGVQPGPDDLDGDHWLDWFFIAASKWRIAMAIIGALAINSAAMLFAAGLRLCFAVLRPVKQPSASIVDNSYSDDIQ